MARVSEHIFHLLSLNISPRYSRAWSHDATSQNLTNFDQVSHNNAPSLDLKGNMLFLANGGALVTFFLNFSIIISIFGFYLICLSSLSYSRNLVHRFKEGR
jgi:hypothetical protein